MQYFILGLKNGLDFKGRATRKEFWYFSLFVFIFQLALTVIDGLLFGSNMLSLIFGLIVLIPSIAVFIRRLHDSGKTGWWALLLIIPLVALIVMIYFGIKPSDGPNKYGPSPLLES